MRAMLSEVSIVLSGVHVLLWWRGGAIGRGRTWDLHVTGSSAASAPLRSGLGQATYTYVPLSPSSISWYQSKAGE